MKCTIIVPSSLTSVFVPVMKESGLDSIGVSQICEQSLTARGKHSPSRTWLRKWKADSWMKPLFSQMSQISHGQTTLRTWLEGFCLSGGLANQSPALESEKPQRTNDGCSTSSQTEFPFSNPECSSRRMSKDSSLQECQTDQASSGIVSRDWKAYITKLRQEYSLRVNAARLTSASGSSSWPTANARDWKDSITGTHPPSRPRMSEQTLGQAVSVVHGQAAPASSSSLGSRQELWATPQSRDFRSAEGNAERWDNPERSRNLNDQMKVWATPNAFAFQPPENTEQWTKRAEYQQTEKGVNLHKPIQSQVLHENEKVVGPMPPSAAKLNPRWVETLMGLPVGWTLPSCASPVTIARMSCGSWEMVSSLPQQNEHSES
jgi:hypothetical protein